MYKLYLLLFISCILSSCSSTFQVSGVEVEKDVNYRQYQTFGFIKVDPSNLIPPLTMDYVAIIQQTIKDRMAERGFRYTDSIPPDLLVNLGFSVEYKTAATTLEARSQADYLGNVDYGWTITPKESSMPSDTKTYKQGVMLLDIVDRNKKSLLWRGSVTSSLADNSTESQRATNLTIAVNQLFTAFQGSNK